MERRRRVEARWSGRIPCRGCDTTLTLNRNRIRVGASGAWSTTCPSCGLTFDVRREDRDLDVARQAAEAEDAVEALRPASMRRRIFRRRRSAAA